MSDPKRMHPSGDNPFKMPLRMDKHSSTTPVFKQENMPLNTDLTSRGQSKEDQLIDPWGFVLTDRYLNRWYRDISGVRVIMDYGGTFGVGAKANTRADVFVSVGYQFNPIYYLGVGQGYGISLNKQESVAPTFVNSRINFLDENTTPYFDFKLGYSFIEGKGVFVNPNIGISFGRNKTAWNLSVGYSFQKAQVKKYDTKFNYKYHGVVFRVGYEFNVFSNGRK